MFKLILCGEHRILGRALALLNLIVLAGEIILPTFVMTAPAKAADDDLPEDWADEGRSASAATAPRSHLLPAEKNFFQQVHKNPVALEPAYRQLLEQLHQHLTARGIASVIQESASGQPTLRILPTSEISSGTAHKLNDFAEELKPHGFKLTYLSAQQLMMLNLQLTATHYDFHKRELFLSGLGLGDIQFLLDSFQVKFLRQMLDLRQQAPLAYQALTEVFFFIDYGPGLDPLPHAPWPAAGIILDPENSIYVPTPIKVPDFHYYARSNYKRPYHDYSNVVFLNTQMAKYTIPSAASSPVIYPPAHIRSANLRAFEILSSTRGLLLHLNPMLYVLLNHPENVYYTFDPATLRLRVNVRPDPQNHEFRYILTLPWAQPVPADGDVTPVLQSPLFQTYFRFFYYLHAQLQYAEYRYAYKFLSISPARLTKLFATWAQLQTAPFFINDDVHAGLWPAATLAKKMNRLQKGLVTSFARELQRVAPQYVASPQRAANCATRLIPPTGRRNK